MSGSGDDAADCRVVLDEVYLYLDLECAEGRRQLIRRHLDECSPCLREYGIEQEVRALVARCCGGERAPEELRRRLRSKLDSLVDGDYDSRGPRRP
ncbi:MAG TPA: mycothiol system anti-sigma-R factor [Pilimelia sp.]|nr:mycothiol system anti-sigma-R factor [Pilimelia sp.]